MVDGVAGSEVRSGTGKYRLFRQRDTAFASVGAFARRAAIFRVRRQRNYAGNGSSSYFPKEQRDHSIIPDHYG